MEALATRILGLVPWIFIGFGALMVLTGLLFAWSDPAALVAVAFGAVFACVGWFARTLMHPPEGMKRVTVERAESWVARINGTTARHRQATAILAPEDADEDAVRADWLAGRLASRPDWVARRLRPDGELETGLVALTAGVTGTVGLAALVVALVWDSGVAWVIAAGGGLVTTLMLGKLARERWHLRKFGASVFAAGAMPFRQGDTLSGTVETGIRPRGGASHPAFRLRLICARRVRETTGSGSDRRSSIREDVLWTGTAEARPRVDRNGRLTVPVAMPIPAEPPPSTLGGDSEGILWTLSVGAPMPGLDYGVAFTLPVLRPDLTPPAPPALPR